MDVYGHFIFLQCSALQGGVGGIVDKLSTRNLQLDIGGVDGVLGQYNNIITVLGKGE